MRENRPCGSEGGEAKSLPYPYRGEKSRAKIVLPDSLIALADFAGLPCSENFYCDPLGLFMQMH
jgi:hypothetical protein